MSGPVVIAGQVLGAERVVAAFQGAAAGAVAKYAQRVERAGLMLLARVKQKLSGEVVNVRTGRLRRSTNEATEVRGAEITSTVGTNVIYARPIEQGFRGTEQVAAYERRLARGGGAVAMVRAHERRVNLAPRSFLVSSLEELRPRIVAELAAP